MTLLQLYVGNGESVHVLTHATVVVTGAAAAHVTPPPLGPTPGVQNPHVSGQYSLHWGYEVQ